MGFKVKYKKTFIEDDIKQSVEFKKERTINFSVKGKESFQNNTSKFIATSKKTKRNKNINAAASFSDMLKNLDTATEDSSQNSQKNSYIFGNVSEKIERSLDVKTNNLLDETKDLKKEFKNKKKEFKDGQRDFKEEKKQFKNDHNKFEESKFKNAVQSVKQYSVNTDRAARDNYDNIHREKIKNEINAKFKKPSAVFIDEKKKFSSDDSDKFVLAKQEGNVPSNNQSKKPFKVAQYLNKRKKQAGQTVEGGGIVITENETFSTTKKVAANSDAYVAAAGTAGASVAAASLNNKKFSEPKDNRKKFKVVSAEKQVFAKENNVTKNVNNRDFDVFNKKAQLNSTKKQRNKKLKRAAATASLKQTLQTKRRINNNVMNMSSSEQSGDSLRDNAGFLLNTVGDITAAVTKRAALSLLKYLIPILAPVLAVGLVIILVVCLLIFCIMGAVSAFSAASNALSGNEAIVYTYLTQELEFTPQGACGVMGNISVESGFDPTAGSESSAFGICQWMGSRTSKLISMEGDNYNTIEGQLDYLAYELKSYGSLTNYLKKSDDANVAAQEFCAVFERCYGNCASLFGHDSDHVAYYEGTLAAPYKGTAFQCLAVREEKAEKYYQTISSGAAVAGDGKTYTSLSNSEIDQIIESCGLSDSKKDKQVEKVLRYALSKVGCQYNQAYHSNTSVNIFDCSSLAYRSYLAAGVKMASSAPTAAGIYSIYEKKGKVVSVNNLQPGDLVFENNQSGRYKSIGHVGIYVTKGKWVEAQGTNSGVVYSDVRDNAIYAVRPLMD